MYYYNARWYDATLGRFITEDPIKDGNNWHVYCANNPMTMIDPTGLEGLNSNGYSSGPRDDAKEWDSERNNKEKDLEKKTDRLKELEDKKGWVAELEKKHLTESVLEGILDYQEAGYGTDWLKDNTEIVIETAIYGKRKVDQWDGELSVTFLGVNLFSAPVHTWADAGGKTLDSGIYKGKLRSDSYWDKKLEKYVPFTYAHAISLSGNGINRYLGYLIHSDVSPGYGENPHQSLNVGYPNGCAYGQGCQIMPGVQSFIDMTDLLQFIGFKYDNSDYINIRIQ